MFSIVLGETRYVSFKDGYVGEKTFKTPTPTITHVKGNSYVDVEYQFDGAYLKHITEDNGLGHLRLYMDSASYIVNALLTNPKCKRLPYYKDIIVLSSKCDTTTVEVEILDEKHKDIKCPYNETTELVLNNEKNYISNHAGGNDDFYPKVDSIVDCYSKSSFRTIPFAAVNTYPVIYDSTTYTLRCYSYIKYRIKYQEGKTEGQLTQLGCKVLKSVSSNPEMLDEYNKTSLQSEYDTKPFNYLIVTTDKYMNAARKLAGWKSMQGFKCRIFSKEKWTGTHTGFVGDDIRSYCDSSNCKPDYLLILGSDGDVPSHEIRIVQATTNTQGGGGSVSYQDDYIKYWTDASLARFTFRNSGEYHYDDMIRGRISVYTQEEATNVVDKIIAYESNPPYDPDFYDNILAISYYESVGNPKNRESKSFDFLSGMEGFNWDLENLGYRIDRHYITHKAEKDGKYKEDGQPQYFPNGVRMPDPMFMNDPAQNTFWDKDPSDITNMINKGKSFVIYRGHGNEKAFSYEIYTQEDVAKLTNGNKTPVFFNITCATGSFEYEDKKEGTLCFAECLLNKKNGGAVGVLANSRVVVHCESQNFGENLLKNIFKNQDISIAEAALRASFKSELGETRQITHWFGDPSMELYTVEPAIFEPEIDYSVKQAITVNTKVQGAKITICSIEDLGESYYETVELNNKTSYTFRNINVPCYISITKANYIPYVTISQRDLYLQNMTFNGYYDIDADKITTGENITANRKNGKFVVEAGDIKLTASKKLSFKAGTSVKKGATLKAKIGEQNHYVYKGNGKPRTTNIPLCFKSLYDRYAVSSDDIFIYDGGNVGSGVGDATSIEDKSSNSNIAIYPNPTSGLLNVVANSNIDEVVVLDIAGNVMMTESANANNVSLDLSSLAKGMYLVKVVTAEDSYIKKVVLK